MKKILIFITAMSSLVCLASCKNNNNKYLSLSFSIYQDENESIKHATITNKWYDSYNYELKIENGQLLFPRINDNVCLSIDVSLDEYNVSNIVFPSYIREFEKGAFSNQLSLKSITLPVNATSIADNAFENCSSLTKIEIPNNIENLGSHVFSGCGSLEEIKIGSGTKEIGAGAFSGSNSKVTIENNMYFTSKEDSIIEASTGKLILGSNHSTIPSSVKVIGENAFEKSAIKKIDIPSTVERIEPCAFIDSSLEEVTIDAKYVGSLSFVGCDNLNEVSINSNVSKIESNAFESLTNLKNLNLVNGIKEIDSYAFYGTAIETLSIPRSLTSIDSTSFMDCSKIARITVDSLNEKYDSRNNCNAIIDKTNDELIVGSSGSVIPNGVKAVGEYAFTKRGINEINIPSTVEKVKEAAFANCKELETLTIESGLVSILDYGFYGCSGLKRVVLPNSLTSLGREVFAKCTSLEEFSFSSSLEDTGECLFIDAKALKTLTIPEGITKLNDNSFTLSSIENVYLPESLEKIKLSMLCNFKDVYYQGDLSSIRNKVVNDLSFGQFEIVIHCIDGDAKFTRE